MTRLLILILVIFILVWFLRRRKTKHITPTNKVNRSNPLSIEVSNHDRSVFRAWLLKELDIPDPDQLPQEAKDAFLMDDWSKLSPDLYSRWSKYYWGL